MPGPQSTASNKDFNSSAGIWALLFVAIFIPLSTQAEIYQWVDGNGKTHFTDSPPEQVQAKQIKLQINSFTSPKISPFVFDPSLISTRAVTQDVVMYSTRWCGVCKKAKRYFSENGIRYVEYDVETSEKGKGDYSKLNGNGVPIILVGDQRMDGFSASSFERIYRSAKSK